MFTKTIDPNYELTGRRKRLTGYIGTLLDGETVIHAQEYPYYGAAESALNQLVFDLLADGLHYSATQMDGSQADDEEQGPDDLNGPPDRARCATCGGEGDCPDCDTLPRYTPPMWDESLHAPSLSQAIAIGLVGDPDPTCEHCGAPAFVWCDGQMFCRSWWQQGKCQISTLDWDDVPSLAIFT